MHGVGCGIYPREDSADLVGNLVAWRSLPGFRVKGVRVRGDGFGIEGSWYTDIRLRAEGLGQRA